MQVVDNASASTIENFLERLGYGPAMEKSQHLLEAIRTDGWRSYGKACVSTETITYSQLAKNEDSIMS